MTKHTYGQLKEIYDRAMIDLKEYLKDPDYSNFSLIEGHDFCHAMSVLHGMTHTILTLDYLQKHEVCKYCPMNRRGMVNTFFRGVNPVEKDFCILSDKVSSKLRKTAYAEHEGEICLGIIQFNEGFKALLEELKDAGRTETSQ
jgi:hypothetical protein